MPHQVTIGSNLVFNVPTEFQNQYHGVPKFDLSQLDTRFPGPAAHTGKKIVSGTNPTPMPELVTPAALYTSGTLPSSVQPAYQPAGTPFEAHDDQKHAPKRIFNGFKSPLA